MAEAIKEWKKKETKTKVKQNIIKMNKKTKNNMSKWYAMM